MPHVTFISPDNKEITADAELDLSVMEVARSHGISGIVAECGGAASCATCHVYVDNAWLRAVPPIGVDEDGMLDFTVSERKENSRLSCQIRVSEQLDGLTVRIPEAQA